MARFYMPLIVAGLICLVAGAVLDRPWGNSLSSAGGIFWGVCLGIYITLRAVARLRP
jgi:hypothetical protein